MSLAAADITVGGIVMPISSVYAITGRWVFGLAVCQFWLSADYTASTASILNLFILSMDRYWSITSPLRYLRRRTKKRALIMIGLVWIGSALWILPIIGWHYVESGGRRMYPPTVCETEFASNVAFKIGAPEGDGIVHFEGVTVNVEYVDISDSGFISQTRNENHIQFSSSTSQYRRNIAQKLVPRKRNNDSESVVLQKEKKAARQLGVIMSAFILCWLPYFVLFMVIAFCSDCVNPIVHTATIWLGYINSTLNPILYPLCNTNFKRAFKKMLRFGTSRGVLRN
ncbi:hypothetical protein L9F63_010689 [Diploptera punctata]|uniref:G-protein coupled receptors family 1 profile domain-containing protein n=1 Tax=Diploptera punctata TaxID=6984 RepID=A0AAD8EQQ8_DIPPU|nr:hypothetical protein L9F63_010689 [Diploptera punctata]